MSKATHPAQHPEQNGQTVVEVIPATTRGASEFEKAVSATKKASIAIIVIHIIGFVVLGFYFWTQIVVTLFALAASSIVLCTRTFEKRTYAMAVALFSLGFVADVLRVVEWFLFVEYLNDSTDDSADNAGVGWVVLFASPCILGAVLFLVGAVCALKANQKWEQVGITLPN